MKKYLFSEVDVNGATIRHIECDTLRELSKEADITTSTLHRIKENKTQNKKKGRYTRCSINILNKEISQ